ncbi:hypothetical protein B0H13DRAFT_1936212 [Mycena leptocephala]|nr:hypothetical protein B0H13DRAFT_1936212 [Mycena leptocephala]
MFIALWEKLFPPKTPPDPPPLQRPRKYPRTIDAAGQQHDLHAEDRRAGPAIQPQYPQHYFRNLPQFQPLVHPFPPIYHPHHPNLPPYYGGLGTSWPNFPCPISGYPPFPPDQQNRWRQASNPALNAPIQYPMPQALLQLTTAAYPNPARTPRLTPPGPVLPTGHGAGRADFRNPVKPESTITATPSPGIRAVHSVGSEMDWPTGSVRREAKAGEEEHKWKHNKCLPLWFLWTFDSTQNSGSSAQGSTNRWLHFSHLFY